MPYTARTDQVANLAVDVQKNGGAQDGTEPWTITADAPFGGDFTPEAGVGDAPGDTTLVGPFYDGRDYTCTFTPIVDFTTPPPVTFTASGTLQTFTGDYLDAVGEVRVLPLVATNVTWELHGPSGYFLEGQGDTTVNGLSNGDYWVRWGWDYDAWPGVAYDAAQVALLAGIGVTAIAPNVTNGAWSTDVQNFSGSLITFTGNYTARSVITKSDTSVGLAITADLYWMGSDIVSDCMKGRAGFDASWFEEWPVNGSTIVRMNSPNASASETFWVFWDGDGSVSLSTEGVQVLDHACVDAVGQTGFSFTANVTHISDGGSNATLGGSTYGWVNLYGSAASPGHLRNIEIVHEDYCGNGTNKDFRKSGPAYTFLGTQARQLMDNCRLLRFLSHSNDVLNPTKAESAPGEAQNWPYGWNGTAWELVWDGPGRQADEICVPTGITTAQAVQQQIDMCNASGSDMWLCAPTMEEPYMNPTQPWHNTIVDMIEAPYDAEGQGGLRSDLKLYVEYSNETWNFVVHAPHYCEYMGRKMAGRSTDHNGDPFPGGPIPVQQGFQDLVDEGVLNGITIILRYTAYRLWKFYEMYSANSTFAAKVPGTYASIADRVKFVVAAQAYNSYSAPVYTRELQVGGEPDQTGAFIQYDGATDCVDIFDYFAVAHYTDPPGGFTRSGPVNPDDWYAQVVTEVDAWMAGDGNPAVWALSHTFANANSLEFCSYEGGPGINGSNYDVPWILYIHEHPSWYGASMQILTEARNNGIDLPVHYTGPFSWNTATDPSFWGLRRTMNEPEPTARKWQAHVDWQHFNNRWHT